MDGIIIKFAIGLAEDFIKSGAATDDLRHSVDGTKVLAHDKYILPLIEQSKITIYDADSIDFRELLASPEWSKQEYLEPEYTETGLQTTED